MISTPYSIRARPDTPGQQTRQKITPRSAGVTTAFDSGGFSGHFPQKTCQKDPGAGQPLGLSGALPSCGVLGFCGEIDVGFVHQWEFRRAATTDFINSNGALIARTCCKDGNALDIFVANTRSAGANSCIRRVRPLQGWATFSLSLPPV